MDRLPADMAARLARHNQQHLLTFWPQLSASERTELLADLKTVDFDLVAQLYREGETSHDWAALAARAGSPPAFRLSGGNSPESADKLQGHPTADEARRSEAEAIPHTAVVLVAGGQGTRLGFDHPKGMFPIGPLSGYSLFQILCEKTLAVGRRHGVRIPFFVMTSPATHDETQRFLSEHERFGLAADDVMLFCQGTMPAVDAESGRLLLAAKHRLALSPDGTGGIVAAMQRHGVLERMKARDIRHVFYMQVDNPLVSVCDPQFLGYHLLAGSEISTQVVTKESPLEPLGNVVSIDGQLHILEYSDLARVAQQQPQLAERRQADGTSIFWAGNLGIHFIETAFLERMTPDFCPLTPDFLPFHVAKKKVPYVDVASGELVSPSKEYAIKFERFVFDMLPAAARAIVVEVDRRTNFAPLKNASGAAKDTPEAVRAQMHDVHRQWLRQAGAEVSDSARVEISPLWALDAEQAQAKLPRGTRVSGDRHFAERDARPGARGQESGVRSQGTQDAGDNRSL